MFNLKLGAYWMLLAAFMFAIMNIYVKKSGEFFNFNEIMFWRMLFSFAYLFFYALITQKKFKTPNFYSHIKRSVMGCFSMILLFYTILKLPIATAVTLSYTTPIWIAFISFVFFKEVISRFIFVCLLIGFCGVCLLLKPNVGGAFNLYILIGLAAGFFAALAYLQVRALTVLNEPGWRIVFYFSLVGTIITALIALLFTGFHPIDLNNMGSIFIMAFSALIGQICLTKAFKEGDKFLVSTLLYFTVIFSAFFGYYFLGEMIDWIEISGIIMIILSGLLIAYFNNLIHRRKKDI